MSIFDQFDTTEQEHEKNLLNIAMDIVTTIDLAKISNIPFIKDAAERFQAKFPNIELPAEGQDRGMNSEVIASLVASLKNYPSIAQDWQDIVAEAGRGPAPVQDEEYEVGR